MLVKNVNHVTEVLFNIPSRNKFWIQCNVRRRHHLWLACRATVWLSSGMIVAVDACGAHHMSTARNCLCMFWRLIVANVLACRATVWLSSRMIVAVDACGAHHTSTARNCLCVFWRLTVANVFNIPSWNKFEFPALDDNVVWLFDSLIICHFGIDADIMDTMWHTNKYKNADSRLVWVTGSGGRVSGPSLSRMHQVRRQNHIPWKIVPINYCYCR